MYIIISTNYPKAPAQQIPTIGPLSSSKIYKFIWGWSLVSEAINVDDFGIELDLDSIMLKECLTRRAPGYYIRIENKNGSRIFGLT